MLIVFRESLAQFQPVIMLIFILVWGLLSGLAASTASADINANFYYLTLDPNATITMQADSSKFQSVQVVPSSSNALVIPGNVQAIWPALQNNQGIMQTVVANQGSIGEWFYIGLEFCCTPEDWQADKAQQVYPGDCIITKYQLINANTGVYNVTWKVERGHSGTQAGEISFTAESFFYPLEHPTPGGQSPFNKALFAIETQGGSKWDFGPVQWDQVTIQADTTRSDWCFKPTNNTDFQHYLSTPTVFISDNEVICEYCLLILGDTKPPATLSSLETTSHTEPGPTTQDLIFSPTTSLTAAVFVYNREPPLPTPNTSGPADAPTSTPSNGLPDPSYSALPVSWESANNHYSSYNSIQMSKYTVVLEADLESVFGTTTIATVDGDSALTTITTDNYKAWATAYAAAHGNGTGNSTIANGDQDSVHLIPMSLPWLMAMLVIMSSVIVGAAAYFIYRPRLREVS
ncbi:uncharacterized protein Bfra_003090 [Botrytis fragariae]|uniref:Uncharacterized protein n=1 Tax=Botrytis fragariae TaxID=1964551 RepID=A0A8H6AZP7_9HELO|nr:uncharacterized protein Bfra_003090 [Botrytis fragariae]KAF5876684.1 hypothetical protein Bfra_003090 [Botrytis fragariae]